MTARERQIVIFTDLDGTLLDARYSWKKAEPALDLIRERDIPLVFCSSKTRAEIELLRRHLDNCHPFVSENGGGIFIPKEYFTLLPSKFNASRDRKYYRIRLGAAYSDLRSAMKELRHKGFDIQGFGDMSVKEISRLTGLKETDARRAKQRDFDEPFVFHGDESSLNKLKQFIRSMGLSYTKGEIFHLKGRSDKGRAVAILKDLYKKKYGRIVTIALGDSPNDSEMFGKVDCPVLIQKTDGSYDKEMKKKDLIKADGTGPAGWNRAILSFLSPHAA